MASEQSYSITLSNNKSEKEGIQLLLEKDDTFINPTAGERKEILQKLNLPPTFARAFDLVKVTKKINQELAEYSIEEIKLIELKTTKQHLPNLPKGFFFGATQNEFDIAQRLGDKYKFCFVSLHEGSKDYALLTLMELEKIIKTKRIQYQINL